MKILIPFLALLLLAACDNQPLQIDEARVRQSLPGRDMTVAYFRIANRGETPCMLRGVDSPVSGVVEVHRHLHNNGQMQMRKVEQFAVPPGDAIRFKPGGYHLMLMDLKQPLAMGEKVEIRFDFGDCGSIERPFAVEGIGQS